MSAGHSTALNLSRMEWRKGELLRRLHAAKVSIVQAYTPTGKLKLAFVKA